MNTPNTIKIIRYSTTGFKPQKQTHHLKDVNYHMYDFNIMTIQNMPDITFHKSMKKHLHFTKNILLT